ncbi:MAG: DUF128 domain-containing protein [bacterium]
MYERIEKKKLAILRILQQSNKLTSSSAITEHLLAMRYDLCGRTVRLYLNEMEEKGFVEKLGKKGYIITETGTRELQTARIVERVGFLAAKIDQMTYRMSFDLKKKKGTVVINISFLKHGQRKEALPLIGKVFAGGYAMGQLLTIFQPNEKIGEMTVPEDMIGIGTVCSITLNGVLLQHGIPTTSRFGGLLEISSNEPVRFAEIINYSGTSLDPLEVFIKSGMTDYAGATETGSGRIGVSFREFPAECRDTVTHLAKKLEKVGLGGFHTIGWPGQPLLEIPVNEGMIGAIVIGGLNPVALLEEKGIKVYSRALAALTDYERLIHYKELVNYI